MTLKTSIATVSISGTLGEKMQAIAAAGFDGIEIFEQDFIADARAPRQIGQMVRDHGLEVMLYQPFRDFECLPPPLRAKAFDRAERKFDVMQELGTDLVLVCSSCHPASLGGIDRAAEDFHALGEQAAKRGLRIGYEALAWGRHVNDHRDAWEIVRRADHPNIGLVVDSFHTLARGIDPDSLRSVPGDKIFFVQLADAPRIDMDLLYWSRHFRNMPGEGDLDVTRFMQAVQATGYAGPISLEIFNDQFRGGSPKTIAQDGYRSLIGLMDDVARAEPDNAQITMPARETVDGVSFIEFAARGDDAVRLQATLAAMGFTLVGRHINKALSLWQQGEIRITVNSETTGWAGSAYTARGTVVCDIGLTVGQATATRIRAEALGAVLFQQPIAPGELDIPAVQGIGGSVLHFLDATVGLEDVWKVEFAATGDAAQSGAGLTRIDHIAQTTTYDEMLSWSLFYTTLFAMKKAPMVDVVDPDGLLRSQAIEGLDGRFRVTLNGAENRRTLAGAFLDETFGSSVQHIAFACDDIFVTAEALRDLGFDALPIPSNYYDDLASRFDLSQAALAQLQSMNVLYDQDENGAFFQVYSRPTSSGMFFEIVARNQGYNGYGAANAPFRIAAMKRLFRTKGMPRY